MQSDRRVVEHRRGFLFNHLVRNLILTALLASTPVWAVTSSFTITITSVMPVANDTSINWRNAGLLGIGGIPSRSTVCATVNPTGITPPTGSDDSVVINAAIASCTAGQVLMLGAGTFQLDMSEYIALNKAITLRGTGSCTNGSDPRCSTIINVRNGALTDWSISNTTGGTNCGVNTSSVVACSAATGVILMSPSGNFNWGWAGCFLGTTPTGCGTTLAVDVAQGATTIQVASTTNFSVGMWVLIDEDPAVVSKTNPTGGAAVNASPEWLSTSSSPATMRFAGGDLPSTFSLNPNRLNAELHKITAISSTCPGAGCTLTFDDPLTLAFRQSGSHGAQVYWPTVQGATANPFLEQAGVENLTITKPANGGIVLQFCAYCWVKNVEVGTWINGAVNMTYSARSQIEFNYFHDCADCENNGVEYPIGVDTSSTESYIVNNIVVLGGKGMVGRGSNTAVVAYNYIDDTFYMTAVIGDYWHDMDINGSHYGGTHHFLFEGNWGHNCDGDETHGSAVYHAFFRNNCTAIRQTFVDPSNGQTVNDATDTAYGQGYPPTHANPGPLRAAGPMAFNYWYAYVGNVLGLAGVTTTGNGWVYQGAFCGGCGGIENKAIWMSGWVGSEWPAPDANLKGTIGSCTLTTCFIFRHGNYDYVNASIPDYASGFSHTLPISLYLTGQTKPAFFTGTSCTYPWPWVTADGATQLQLNSCSGAGLPARARFDAGTPFVQP